MNIIYRILGFLAVLMGIIAVAFKSGFNKANDKIKQANLKRKEKVDKALDAQRKRNEQETKENADKAENNDFSGLNRKPIVHNDDE